MTASRKLKKRPCSVCRRWFQPNPRTVHCQKTCGPACRKLWEAKRQAKWRSENPDYDAHLRLSAQLEQAEQAGAAIEILPAAAPMARLPWRLAQTALGVKMAVVLALALRLRGEKPQTAFRVKIRMLTSSPGRLPPSAPQTALGSGP